MARVLTGYKIIERRVLSEGIIEMTLYAPRVAAKVRAGQFFILRAYEGGERVPFTFSDWSDSEGWIRFIFMAVGKTTEYLAELRGGQCVADVAGPLGRPTELTAGSGRGPVVVVGGGVGTAVAYPVARMLSGSGAGGGREVTTIVGARNARLLILQNELRALPLARELLVMTDDGSAGRRGLVTSALEEVCAQADAEGHPFEEAFIVGPALMMRFSAQTALDADVPATVSLNPLMIDGSGMCGACRVTVDGVVRFACIDGPDFPAAGVDWAELINRQRGYVDAERVAQASWNRARHHADCSCFSVEEYDHDEPGDKE